MGFGGAHTMSVVLKNNRNLLRKRKKFVKPLGGYSTSKKTEYNLPIASKRDLDFIKNRLQREQRERLQKRIVVFVFIVTMICCAGFYVLKLYAK